MSRLILGASHKMYFGWGQSVAWCREVCRILHQERYQPFLAKMTLFTFPAMPVIAPALDIFSSTPMAVGAQNICADEPGAWTGETSAQMIHEMGGRYAEIGHAERVNHFNETPEMTARKIGVALRHGLTPVVCLGGAQRQSRESAAQEAVRQVQELLQMADLSVCRSAEMIFAWEPQWAIGAREAADEHDIRYVCRVLRDHLRVHSPVPASVIYGGSAGPGLLNKLWPDVDGLFLGRFSHDPAGFQSVLEEAVALTALSGD